MRGRQSCIDVSLSAKFLLIAAYLASKHSKKQDIYVFGNAQKGRRRKERKGSRTGEKDEGINRPFTLDRLMSIFSTIMCSRGIDCLSDSYRASLSLSGLGSEALAAAWKDTIERTFGDAQLFASLHTLEDLRFVAKGPGWSLASPTYLSAVSSSLALEVSTSVGFDLYSFVIL